MAELKYEIKEHLGVLSENAKGWTKELNLVSWNDNDPKFDIREWSPDHTRMSKGITLTEEEMQSLVELFNARDEEDSFEYYLTKQKRAELNSALFSSVYNLSCVSESFFQLHQLQCT